MGVNPALFLLFGGGVAFLLYKARNGGIINDGRITGSSDVSLTNDLGGIFAMSLDENDPDYGVYAKMTKEEIATITRKAFYNLYSSMVKEEGFMNCAYTDSLGKWTIGIGHLIVDGDGFKKDKNYCISDQEVVRLWQKDIPQYFNAAVSNAQELNRFTPEFIEALTHVNYQLGIGWKSTFKNTYNQLKTGNYRAAINNLRSSAWADQTPRRVANFIDAINEAYA